MTRGILATSVGRRVMRRIFPILTGMLIALAVSSCENGEISEYQRIERAQELLDAGDVRAAIVELKIALQRTPTNTEARELLARAYVDVGNGTGAEKEISKAMELGLPRASGETTLMRALALQGNPDLILLESNVVERGMSKSDRGIILSLRGLAFLSKKQPTLAQQAFDKAVAIDPQGVPGLVGKAMVYGMGGNYDAAYGLALRATQIDASSPEAWSALGEFELARGNDAEAEAAFDNAVELTRYPTLNLAKRALARVRLGEFAAAENDLARLKTEGVDHPFVDYVLGVNYFTQGLYAEAEAPFRASYERAPSFRAGEVYLAATHLLQGHVEQALSLVDRAYAKAPQSKTGGLLFIGSFSAHRPELEAVTQALKAALHADPENPTIQRLLAPTLLLEGDTGKRVEYYRALAAVEPDSRRARGMLLTAKLMEPQTSGPADPEDSEVEHAVPDDYQAALFGALQLFKNGDLEEALEEGRELQQKYPDEVDPANLVAACYLRLGQWDRAKVELENARRIAPNDPSATKNLAKVALREGKIEQARGLLEGMLAAYPGDQDGVLLLAKVTAQSGTREDAIRVLERAIQRGPSGPIIVTRLATEYLRDRRFEDVLKTTDHLTSRHFEARPALLGIRGKAQLGLGDLESAQRSFGLWAEVKPDSAEAHFLYGETLALHGDVDQAREQLERTLELDPKHFAARLGQVKLWAELEQPGKAKEALARIRADFGEAPEVLDKEAALALQIGDFGTAVELFYALASIRPSTGVTIGLVKSLWGQRETERAIEVMRDWLSDHGGDLTVQLHLAGAYLALDREKDALRLYRAVVKTHPGHIPALNNLAWLTRNDDLDQAIGYAQQAYVLLPDDPAVLDTLGMLLLKRGEAERGYDLIQQAAVAYPENAELQLHLGQALLQRGLLDQARETLGGMAGKWPESPFTEQARALLASNPR